MRSERGLRGSARRALAVWLATLGLVGAAHGADSWGYDLGHDLMSPYCPGRTLATCPSPQAAELVQWIVMQESAGVSREQVIEMLVERFGEEILGAPPARGITLWAYVFPIAGFLAGGGLAFVVLRRIVRSGARGSAAAGDDEADASLGPAPAPSGAAPLSSSDELARIVDEDLARRA